MYVLYAIALITAYSTKPRPRSEKESEGRRTNIKGEEEVNHVVARPCSRERRTAVRRHQDAEYRARTQINRSRLRSTSTEHVSRITGTDYITLENAHAARTQINRSRLRSTSTEHVARITGTDYITLENAHAARTHIHRVRGECGIGTERKAPRPSTVPIARERETRRTSTTLSITTSTNYSRYTKEECT